MHELGVVFNVIRRVEEIAAENDVSEVRKVSLRIGEVSTVVPALLIDCWNWAVKRTEVLQGAELVIDRIPAVSFCEDCKKEYPTLPNGKICPNCGSANTFLVQGNEFEIRNIEVTDPEEKASVAPPDVSDIPEAAMTDAPDMSVIDEIDPDDLPAMEDIPEEPLDDIPDIPEEELEQQI